MAGCCALTGIERSHAPRAGRSGIHVSSLPLSGTLAACGGTFPTCPKRTTFPACPFSGTLETCPHSFVRLHGRVGPSRIALAEVVPARSEIADDHPDRQAGQVSRVGDGTHQTRHAK